MTKSPIPYIGGKSILSRQIIDLIPEHRTYCEPFCGGAWVFFRKPPSKYETLNDMDCDLTNFFKVLQNHLEEFLKQFRWLLSSRELFNDWTRQTEAGGLTDIQRAARYYYLQRHGFGGHVMRRTFGASPDRAPRINLLRMEEELSAVHLRLIRCVIENLPWADCVTRYDRLSTFFYIDPPYWQAPYYKYNMDLDDYKDMASTLANIKGKFILSINDKPEIRNVFQAFHIRPVTLNYSVSKGRHTKGKELLIDNFR